MRKNVLPITAGVLGSLALAVSASADFTGTQTQFKGSYDTAGAFSGPDVGWVDVWNVYLLFNNPLDTLNAIFVITEEPFTSMVHSSDLVTEFDGLGGGFWNWSFGGNTPLTGAFFDLDPAAASADTYLTIGLKAGTFPDGGDAAFFAPGTEAVLVESGILDGSGSINELFSYNATPDDAQSFPVEGRILVLQVAVLTGQHASGIWNIQWGTFDPASGGPVQERITWTTVPAPGAMALLGLAGLAGARRRRRG